MEIETLVVILIYSVYNNTKNEYLHVLNIYINLIYKTKSERYDKSLGTADMKHNKASSVFYLKFILFRFEFNYSIENASFMYHELHLKEIIPYDLCRERFLSTLRPESSRNANVTASGQFYVRSYKPEILRIRVKFPLFSEVTKYMNLMANKNNLRNL